MEPCSYYRYYPYSTDYRLDQISFYIMRAARPVGRFNSTNHDDMLSHALQYLYSHRSQLPQQFPAFSNSSNFQRLACRVSSTWLNEANRARSTTSQTPRLLQPHNDPNIQAPRRSSGRTATTHLLHAQDAVDTTAAPPVPSKHPVPTAGKSSKITKPTRPRQQAPHKEVSKSAKRSPSVPTTLALLKRPRRHGAPYHYR